MGFAKMNEQEINQAKRLGSLYAELAEQGTWFEWFDSIDNGWIKVTPNPTTSNDLSQWRVAEKQDKIIDMSCLVGSDIDCEFYSNVDDEWKISKLTKMHNQGFQYLDSTNSYKSKCRVRQDHWHSWQGGDKCPLPEGLDCKFKFRGLHDAEGYSHSVNSDNSWQHTDSDLDIIAFKVLGIAEGYKYE